ncbi:MAG: VC0807 family protein [Pseudonocardiaceae bacterium]
MIHHTTANTPRDGPQGPDIIDPAHDDGPAAAPPAAGRATWIKGLLWDVGLPVASYYGLRLAGASAWVALLGATLAAGLRIVWVAVRDRKLNPFATVMLIIYGLELVLVFASDEPRFLLLKHSITSGTLGIAFLVSIAAGRPLTLAVAQSWEPDEAQKHETLYRTDPHVRHGFRVSATVWGLGGLIEALIRVIVIYQVPLIYLLPIDVLVGLSTAMIVVTNGGLLMWNIRYDAGRRQRPTSADDPTQQARTAVNQCPTNSGAATEITPTAGAGRTRGSVGSSLADPRSTSSR